MPPMDWRNCGKLVFLTEVLRRGCLNLVLNVFLLTKNARGLAGGLKSTSLTLMPILKDLSAIDDDEELNRSRWLWYAPTTAPDSGVSTPPYPQVHDHLGTRHRCARRLPAHRSLHLRSELVGRASP